MTDKAFHVQKDVRRPMRKKVPLHMEDGRAAFTTEPDGHEAADIEVIVDMAQIARHIGPRNSKGVSRYLEGCVIVTVTNRRRLNA